jgi:hypothetical protein
MRRRHASPRATDGTTGTGTADRLGDQPRDYSTATTPGSFGSAEPGGPLPRASASTDPALSHPALIALARLLARRAARDARDGAGDTQPPQSLETDNEEALPSFENRARVRPE